jgi:SAM-dependent methyltransferase
MNSEERTPLAPAIEAGHSFVDLIREFDAGRFTRSGGEASWINAGVAEVAGVKKRRLIVHPPAWIEFRIPAIPCLLTFDLAILPEVWGHRISPCRFIVKLDGEDVFHTTLDPRRNENHRRWFSYGVAIRDRVPGGERVLRLETSGVFCPDHLWAAFGNLALWMTDLPREVRKVGTDPRNLQLAFDDEVGFWNDQLARKTVVAKRYGTREEMHSECPEFLIDLCQRFVTEKGRPPEVLDFACGPVSSLAYLHAEGLAILLGADALAREFEVLREKNGVSAPGSYIYARGETITEALRGHTFDIVYVQNALDHTQCPALTWMNLFRLVRPGGFMAHKHFVREASRLAFFQLHQFDLYPVGDSLWIEDKKKHAFSLTDGLALRCAVSGSNSFDSFEGPMTAFWNAWVKEEEGLPSAELLSHALDQFTTAFRARDEWAAELEDFFLRLTDREIVYAPHAGRQRCPYVLRPRSSD